MKDTKKIAVKRVPGTAEHSKIREFLISELSRYGWSVEKDEFSEETPLGLKGFTNLIATLPSLSSPTSSSLPSLDRRQHKELVMAAHYDSKHFTEFEFVGATDSAVPCALLLDLARTLPLIVEGRNQRITSFSPSVLFSPLFSVLLQVLTYSPPFSLSKRECKTRKEDWY
jgi:glutaminyl-peptide cyclotransferase